MRPTHLLVIGATLLAACDGGATANTDRVSSNDAPPLRSDSPTNPLPAVDVINVVTGDEVALAELVPAPKPTLVWLWAPH